MKNKNIIIIGASAALLIIGGIIWYRSRKPKGEETPPSDTPPIEETKSETPKSTSQPSQQSVSNPFKSKQEVKDFQDWLDKNYPTWLNGGKLNGGSGYGSFGQNTAAAWVKYNKEYTRKATISEQLLSDTSAKKFRNIKALKDGVRVYQELKKGTKSWNYYKKGDIIGKSSVAEDKLSFPIDLQIDLVIGNVGKGDLQYIRLKTEYGTTAYVNPSDVKVGSVLMLE